MRDDAASNPLSFVVAGSLIIAIIGVALFTTADIGGPSAISSSNTANREVQAQGLLSLIVDGDPSGTSRLSLKHSGGDSLDIETFRELQATQYTTDTTDMLDYAEAKSGLEVDGMDFHIRSYPTLQSARDLLNARDENLDVAYIGHVLTQFNGGDAPTIDSLECGESPFDEEDTIRYTLTVSNTGTEATQFRAVLEIRNGNGNGFNIQDQSGLIPSGGAGTITLDVPNTEDTACLSTTDVDVDLYGQNKKLASQTFEAPIPVDESGPSTTLDEGLGLTLSEHYYPAGGQVVVEYLADQHDVLDWKLYLASDLENQMQSGSLTVPHKNNAEFGKITFTAPDVQPEDLEASPSGYLIKVNHQQHSATATQRVLVMPTGYDVASFTPATAPAGTNPDPAMELEAGMIEELMARFNPSPFNADTNPGYLTDYNHDDGSPGDVYWDEKKTLTDSLPDRIAVTSINDCVPKNNDPDQPFPNIIVVGSNVDHQAMTSGPFKNPLAEWVYCGGLLIVFGSPDGTTQWMQPIFHVGDQQVTGGISAPDTTHPLLRVPNQLDFEGYENHDRTWRYTGNADDHFTNIVNQGSDPITAISDPGDFGRGSVLISNWLPYDIFGDGTGLDEGMYLMDNFLTQAYRDLFLDYGPPIPTNSPVVPAIRQSQVILTSDDTLVDGKRQPAYHAMCRDNPLTTKFDECHVDMTVLLYVF